MARSRLTVRSFVTIFGAGGPVAAHAMPIAIGLFLSAVVVGLTVGRSSMLENAAHVRTNPIRPIVHWPAMGGSSGGAREASVPYTTDPNKTWLDLETRSRIERLIAESVSIDPFDGASLEKAQVTLMATGWFDGPVHVARENAGVVRVQGKWRVPAAVVREPGVDRLVTRQAEVLDKVYETGQSRFPVVLGAAYPPPNAGKQWTGGDVLAGLDLLDFLRGMPGFEQIHGVDVADYLTRKRLVLVTDLGNRIIWGGSPSEFVPGQARPEVKKSHLIDLYQNPRFSRRIDAGQRLVDVSLEAGVTIISTAPVSGSPEGEFASSRREANHLDE